MEMINRNITTTLFGSKARVDPLKKLTIPKLELQGCVLGTRFAILLPFELRLPKVDREVFWSDSKTVLAWIRSEAGRHKGKRQKEPTGDGFQQARILLIYRPDLKHRFHLNLRTCGTLGQNSLKDQKRSCPRKQKAKTLGIILATRILKLGDDSRFSPSTFTVSPEEYRSAVRTLVQWVQTESFPREIAELAKGRIVKKAKIARLFPCLINGNICLKGRILQANKVPAKQKTPAILPSDHHVTELLIQAEHERCAHQGSETLLNNLRGRFWIIDGRQTVLRSIRNCPRCRLSRASPVIPEMGQLPHYRLAAYQRPFTFTGLDAFEPFTVTVGRRHEKRWIIIFTCLVTRAIHLEVVHALSTDEFMMGLFRFIDTRGRPDTIYSDNGTNFVGEGNELKLAASEIDFEVMSTSGRFGPVIWEFNPPAAPHFGGAWERLIKSVKKCLRATLNEVNSNDTTLIIALKSAENIINSRPLTYVSTHPTEEDSLTLNHFLHGANDAGPSIPKLIETNNRDLKEQWKRAQQLNNEFYIEWTRDYIPKHITRNKWHHQTKLIRTGDLVFPVDELHPRNMWKRGFVSDVHFGPDGQVRVATITTKQNGKAVIYKRPVTKICPL
ncbi:hypothetical protein LAZ67_7001494 [Cordylochernes scorpioides]|uniref:Integrase catalytic domain-containing protein n=1 Tax=Cordylochernes scorpioides TaxID=51811 RepID=A0ABY6KQA1_9ARAC|nr:hypothetical protein LAZ67_7001494 [Cordylochernes scorpioides]